MTVGVRDKKIELLQVFVYMIMSSNVKAKNNGPKI